MGKHLYLEQTEPRRRVHAVLYPPEVQCNRRSKLQSSYRYNTSAATGNIDDQEERLVDGTNANASRMLCRHLRFCGQPPNQLASVVVYCLYQGPRLVGDCNDCGSAMRQSFD